MDDFRARLRGRLLPALLVALGAVFLTSGLLSWTAPAEAGPPLAGAPSPVTAPPDQSSAPGPSFDPNAGPTPTFPADRVATRVVVPALSIDLPVIRPPGGSGAYPLCDVAMFLQELGQPGAGRVTFIYAHARPGMFLPILDASQVDNGAKLIGMVVQVYTNDDFVFLYQVSEVRRHQLTLDDAFAVGTEQLWLQTSEGPAGTKPKTEIMALPLSSGRADPTEAHPDARPRECR